MPKQLRCVDKTTLTWDQLRLVLLSSPLRGRVLLTLDMTEAFCRASCCYTVERLRDGEPYRKIWKIETSACAAVVITLGLLPVLADRQPSTFGLERLVPRTGRILPNEG